MKLGVNGRFLAARPTGVQRFAHEVTARLSNRVATTVLVPKSAPEVTFDARVIRGRLDGPTWEQLELPRAARRAGVDVTLHPANSAPRFGGPHVQVLHDLTPLSRPSDFRLPYRLWVRWAHLGAARYAAGLITVSEYSADQIARTVDVPRERIRVVRQGVAPLDSPASTHQIVATRARYGVPERYFLAMNPGDPRKGLDLLFDVFTRWSQTTEAHPAVALVVVGGSHAHVHAPTRSGSDVHRLGQVDDGDLRALYSGATAFLFPSQDEGFGRPPLEALACGTRVVTTPYAVAAEVLGGEADMVPSEPGRWIAALTDLLKETPADRATRIERGRSWAAGFTWDSTVDDILDVCEGVARRGNGRTKADSR